MRSKYEKLAEKELEKEGELVDWKIRSRRTPRGYSVDYFGLFDLVCYRNGYPLRWIAIKGHMGVPNVLRQGIKEFKPIGYQKEIWTFGKNKKVRKEIIK